MWLRDWFWMRPICEIVRGAISKQSWADQYHLQWQWQYHLQWQSRPVPLAVARVAKVANVERDSSASRGAGNQILKRASHHTSAKPTSFVCWPMHTAKNGPRIWECAFIGLLKTKTSRYLLFIQIHQPFIKTEGSSSCKYFLKLLLLTTSHHPDHRANTLKPSYTSVLSALLV